MILADKRYIFLVFPESSGPRPGHVFRGVTGSSSSTVVTSPLFLYLPTGAWWEPGVPLSVCQGLCVGAAASARVLRRFLGHACVGGSDSECKWLLAPFAACGAKVGLRSVACGPGVKLGDDTAPALVHSPPPHPGAVSKGVS